MSAFVLRKLQQARQQLQSGDIDTAAALCEDVLRRAPRNPEALWLLGTARLMAQRVQDAVPLFERVLAAAPDHGAALEHLGLAHLMMGAYSQAEAVLRKAAAIPGAPSSVPMRLGLALLHQERHAEAIEALQRALRLNPGDLDAHLGLGRAQGAAGHWADAAREFEIVLAQVPQHADALYNMGVVSFERGEVDRARTWFEQSLLQAPTHIEARERLGTVCLAQGRFPEALSHLRTVIERQPDNTGALNAFAEASFQCGELDQARDAALKARDLDAGQPGPHTLLAQIHHVRGELDRAVEFLEAGLARTDADVLLGALVHLTHRQCDWEKWSRAWQQMAARLDHADDLGSPFWLLCEATTPEQQLSYTKRWVSKHYLTPAATSPQRSTARAQAGSRVRIGYCSGDFHQHPVPCLMAEVLELHDRNRFEIYAYSYGPDDQSAMRERLRQAVDHFVDVAWDPDDLVAERIRSDDLDILVDMKGYTAGDRLGIMAGRPAPVQIEWLGYPATTGAPFIDYVIADASIIPPGTERFYSERVLRMPHCYQANDRKRATPPPLPRSDYGLPDDGFVFCCFNQAVKITPEIFSRWMALLQAVPGSVLWLLDDNVWATRNLLNAAESHGVESKRVIIAPRLLPGEHLARYRAADLALDTFPYTSHTTGSDALWQGCPLVALRGETFAARVSSSLLTSCGVPDLITGSIGDYEQLAFRLATDRALMHETRARLAAAHDNAVLFDSERFTRDLEQLYLQLVPD